MKKFLKLLANIVASLCAFPWLIVYHIYRVISGDDRAVQWISQRVCRWPGFTGEYLRRAVLKYVLEYVGSEAVISFGTIFSRRNVRIGNGAYIGAYCVIGQVHIGENTLIGDSVIIPSGRHQHNFERIDLPIKHQQGQIETIRIGKDCWIGSGAIILADVANHCVVSAGAVVKDSTNEYEIVAGNPAKTVNKRVH